MNLPKPHQLVDRVRDNSHIVAALLTALVTVAALVTLFVLYGDSYQQTVNARDNEIGRLAVSYSKLRDQDFTLGITPAAPSLAQVESPNSKSPGLPVPRSFTAAFPTGYFTCIDRTGEGNYFCNVTRPTPTTVPKR